MAKAEEATLMTCRRTSRLGGGLAHPVPRETTTRTAPSWAEHATGRPCRSSARARRSSARASRHRRARLGRDHGARRDGVVDSVDATRIVVRPSTESESDPLSAKPDIYTSRSSSVEQNTCINQKPIVERGDIVKMGEVIADGPATERGELGPRRDIPRRVHPWGGYNFETRSSSPSTRQERPLHLYPHRGVRGASRRDTKLGKEESPATIPNVGEEALKDLDESGSCAFGAGSKPQDILVGKITPKGETQLSRGEACARSSARRPATCATARCASRRACRGVVISAKVFSRRARKGRARQGHRGTPRRGSSSPTSATR